MSQCALPPSDHFDGRRFLNPNGPALQPFSAVPRMLMERRARWPAWIDEPAGTVPALGDANAVVTFIGHATFLIQTPSGNIVTDPMFSDRAGPWNIIGPRRVRRPAIPIESLPPISTILLSHNHYDHCDLRSLRMLANRFDPLVITPLGNGWLARQAGIRRVEELDWWQPAIAGEVPITLTRAHHFCARGPFDRNGALWGGFVFTAGARRIYFAGDTAYVPFFGEIRERCGPIDLALLPIGAYEPRWFMRSVHMNPAEAVQAHIDLQAAASIAMHFGTFQLTTEAIDAPIRALEQTCAERQIAPGAFRALAFGESVRV
jgi:L-ascorbate metabolism protein UlaG (beta-lactamase superfamily)